MSRAVPPARKPGLFERLWGCDPSHPNAPGSPTRQPGLFRQFRIVDWRLVAVVGLPLWAFLIGFVVAHKRAPRVPEPVAATALAGPNGLTTPAPAPGESIPEHDELGRGHEEVFLVLEGDAVIVIDGVDHPLRTGSFARLAPEPKRTVRNDGDSPARVLIVSAPVGSGYEPLDWA